MTGLGVPPSSPAARDEVDRRRRELVAAEPAEDVSIDSGVPFNPLVEVRQAIPPFNLGDQLENETRRPTDSLYLMLPAEAGIERCLVAPSVRPVGSAGARRRPPLGHKGLLGCRLRIARLLLRCKPRVNFRLDPGDPVVADVDRLRELVSLPFPAQMIAAVVDPFQGTQTFEIDELHIHPRMRRDASRRVVSGLCEPSDLA
jgi:hypothetical protein